MTEGSMDPQLQGRNRCINQQVKQNEDENMNNPGEITKPSTDENKEGREKDKSAKEEQEDPANQDMPQKDGWLRRNGGNQKNLLKKCLRQKILSSVCHPRRTRPSGTKAPDLGQGYPTPGGGN